jgi:glycolate oxidase FAD binding subunit
MSDLLAELATTVGGHLAEAGPSDSVGSMPARWVARPGCTDEVAAVLRAAAAGGLTVVARGAGTKLGWGAPPERLDLIIDSSRMDGLVEHSAGDLVCVVQAGKRLAALQDELGSAGQRLGIDPARCGTVGGAVATASTGPNRLHHGPVRDLVIGMTFVRADGTIAHSGGKVVKNVAGYDLGKLLTGSFGTLAVITEVAFRLHPVPAARRWVSVEVDGHAGIQRLVQSIAHAQLVPTAVELDHSEGCGTVTLLLEGTAAGLQGRVEQALALLGDDANETDDPPEWWGAEPTESGEPLLKVTHTLAGLSRLLAVVDEAAQGAGVPARFRGSALVGTALVGLGGQPSPAAVAAFLAKLREQASSFGGTVVLLEAAPEALASLDVWGPVGGLELMRSVKQQFDPERLLAPGRFVGGI